MPVSPMGSVANHVVLEVSFDSDEVCGPGTNWTVHQQFPDRSDDPVAYQVPAGKALVIMNLSFRPFSSVGNWTAGKYLKITVGVEGIGLYTTGGVINSDIAATTFITVNDNVSGGIVFHAGEEVCIVAARQVGSTGNTSGVSLNGSILRGHLVDQ